MTNIEIKGMDEIQEILRELPYQVRTNLVFSALRKAAKPMKDESVNLAPKRKGTIQKAITIVKNQYEDKPGIMIAPTKGKKMVYDAWYARFQEFGTSGFGKRKRSLSSVSVDLKRGAVHRKYKTTGYRLSGSGLPAVRFMSKAFDAKKEQVLNNIHTELSKVVTNYLRKKAPHYYAS